MLKGSIFCLKHNCWLTVQVFGFVFCLFLKDSHRFGKNIQKAMVDIMGLFNLSKNCTKWLPYWCQPISCCWDENSSAQWMRARFLKQLMKKLSQHLLDHLWKPYQCIESFFFFFLFFSVVWKSLFPQRMTFEILYISRDEVYYHCMKSCIFLTPAVFS